MTRDHIYLSGPMTGRVDDNKPAFNAAAERLRSMGFQVINPAAAAEQPSWEEYMRADIGFLVTECYGLVYLPGWEESRGALTEVYIANALHMPTVAIDDELGLYRLLQLKDAAPSTHQVVMTHALPTSKELLS